MGKLMMNEKLNPVSTQGDVYLTMNTMNRRVVN